MKILGYDLSPPKGVVVSKIKIHGKNGNIPALVVHKEGVTEPAPGVLWIHGGGYATGMKEMLYIGRGIDLSLRHGAVVMAWRMYLKGIADKDVSVYAAPARQTDYSGLPPAYTFVCTTEPFYCETMTFIDNLKKAGIEATVDVYEGLYHAFDMNSPKLDISNEAIERFNERFAYAKEHYFAKQSEDKP